MRSKEELLEFLNSKLLMVVSTVNEEGSPESAVVGFGQTDNFELVFGTSVKSRKAKNILKDNRVSAVIGWEDEGTMQLEGTARILHGDEITSYTEPYFLKSPKARQYKDDPDECYILITPNWLRFTELTSYPWTLTELRF